MERTHTILYDTVGRAAAPISHLETGWSESEIVKRVVRYIYKAAQSEELLTLHWEKSVAMFVENAMSCYTAACSDKPWFFEMDLAPAFCAVANVLIKNSGQRMPHVRDVDALVVQEYEDKLDRTLLTKAMWDATRASFKDATVQSKINNALSKAYWPALDEVLADTREIQDLARVENFTKKWLEDSMSRAWSAVDQCGEKLSEGNLSRLFQNLVAPFGDDHPFSCIPAALTEHIGRPPRDWAYIRQAVKNLFASWQRQLGTTSKKRKKNGGEAAIDEDDMKDTPPRARAVVDGDDDKDSMVNGAAGGELSPPPAGPSGEGGHNECTSQEDCIGTPYDRLVRHWLNGSAGDLYCETCWESFVAQNASLEGIWEGEDEPGEAA